MFLSSADWMPRNFQRRVEIMFPIEDPQLKRRLVDGVLGVVLADNVKARQLQADGTYRRTRPLKRASPAFARSSNFRIWRSSSARPARSVMRRPPWGRETAR